MTVSMGSLFSHNSIVSLPLLKRAEGVGHVGFIQQFLPQFKLLTVLQILLKVFLLLGSLLRLNLVDQRDNIRILHVLLDKEKGYLLKFVRIHVFFAEEAVGSRGEVEIFFL